MDEDEDEDPLLIELRQAIQNGEIHKDFLDDAECGFTRIQAIRFLDKLSDVDIRRIAAMAIWHQISEWSDRGRDIVLGIENLLTEKGLELPEF